MKNEPFDEFETLIEEELARQEKVVDEIIQSRADIQEIKAGDNLKEKIFNQIQHIQEEPEKQDTQTQDKVVNMLSKEDREALLAGRAYLKQKQDDTQVPVRTVVKKKKKIWKQIVILAAAIGAMFAMGITSIGGPEKVINVIKQTIAGREMAVINSSSEEILSSKESNEEKAYQKIEDEYGIDVVKILNKPEGMTFEKAEINTKLQTTIMLYQSNGQQVVYIINTSNAESSMGVDVEDKLIEEKNVKLKKAEAIVKKYKVKDTDKIEYLITFKYQKTYYTLVSRMEWEEIEVILNNLHFF